MNSFFLGIILVPIIEIYLLIKIGSEIGALTTILLIFTTAIVGVYYAKYEGLNTLKSGFLQLSKNQYKISSHQSLLASSLTKSQSSRSKPITFRALPLKMSKRS